MKTMKKNIALIFMLGFLSLLLWGCSIEKTDGSKVRDLEFSIVEESLVPVELMAEIEANKAEPFKISFSSEESRYIAVGYGRQATNGYSIAVEELYLTPNAVYIKTNLLGPSKGEAFSDVGSFPFIVVKISYLDKNIVFE